MRPIAEFYAPLLVALKFDGGRRPRAAKEPQGVFRMKKILGITVLLAVVAMGLVFTACPDIQERSVLFINQTTIDIRLQGNFGTLTLPKATKSGTNVTDGEVTAKMTGKPVILERIVPTGNPLVEAQPENYIYLDGDVTASQKQPNSGAISLESGIITFKPLQVLGGNPISPFKIDAISFDE